MAGPVTQSRRSLYRAARLAQPHRLAGFSAIVVIGLQAGGCAVSGRLGNLFEGEELAHTALAADRNDVTGGIKPKGMTGLPPAIDLTFAKAAAADVLSRGMASESAPWENPRTGARGTVTPLAVAYTQNGLTCRDFLASHIAGGAESWMQGEACQADKGRWEVRSLRPWRRT